MNQQEQDIALMRIRATIAEYANSKSDIETLLAELHQTNWKEREYREKLEKVHCQNYLCESLVKTEDLYFDEKLEKPHFCKRCEKKHRANYTIPCDFCGLLLDNSNHDKYHENICGKCASNYPDARKAIQNAISRGQMSKLPTHLTYKEWTRAIDFFSNTCAYCGELPKSRKGWKVRLVCEHYLPIVHGGHTTITNLVPSCPSCNNKKSNLLPEEFEPLFPSGRIQRIHDFFEQESKE